ncbi:lipopolysaccharide assembly protein LapA domain-containing protein [Thiobacter aerophilum]|uniref:Lipopolysaccharide assembly protein LapA domain-containing protein n=1 Tax=Thiobacter aerophilum TaxID=3121275 RepID=A0ABV0EF75_9BURK
MRFVTPILGVFLFLLAVGFAAKNSEVVTVRYYLGAEWQAPLVVVLLVVFVLGVAAGVAASFSYLLRSRREILALKRELRSRNQEAPRAQEAQGNGT